MWPSIVARDANWHIVYVSAAYDPSTGILASDPVARVYEANRGVSITLARVLGSSATPRGHDAGSGLTAPRCT